MNTRPSPAIGVDRIDGEEAVIAEASIGNGRRGEAAGRVLDGDSRGVGPLSGGENAEPRVGALQGAGSTAPFPPNPTAGASESAGRQGRVSRDKVMERQHGSWEVSGARLRRRRRARGAALAIRVITRAMHTSGEEEASPRTAELGGGSELGAIFKEVGLEIGVSVNVIKREELLFKADVHAAGQLLRLGEQVSIRIIKVDTPGRVAVNSFGRRLISRRTQRNRTGHVSLANADTRTKGEQEGHAREARRRAVAAAGHGQAEENVGNRPTARHGPPRVRQTRRRRDGRGRHRVSTSRPGSGQSCLFAGVAKTRVLKGGGSLGYFVFYP